MKGSDYALIALTAKTMLKVDAESIPYEQRQGIRTFLRELASNFAVADTRFDRDKFLENSGIPK
jgi:hypothetical protein